MRTALPLSVVVICAFLGLPAWAADPDPNDHQAHHPAASAPSASQPTVKSTPKPKSAASAPSPAVRDQMTRADGQMKMMADMHQKMMSAKTPQERQSMMGEQMKMMQDGMAMMNMMGGMQGGGAMPGNMGERQQMLEKRMDMMQMMMQSIMDRMPTSPSN